MTSRPTLRRLRTESEVPCRIADDVQPLMGRRLPRTRDVDAHGTGKQPAVSLSEGSTKEMRPGFVPTWTPLGLSNSTKVGLAYGIREQLYGGWKPIVCVCVRVLTLKAQVTRSFGTLSATATV